MTERRPITGPDDPRHGTRNLYTNFGCRCLACCEGARAYDRRRRAYRGPRPTQTHGIRATYCDGCRCDRCREAERRYRADYRSRTG